MNEIPHEKRREFQRAPRQLAVVEKGQGYGPDPNFIYCLFFDAVDWIDTVGWNCPQCGLFNSYLGAGFYGVTKPKTTGPLYGMRYCTNKQCKVMCAYLRDPTPEEMAKEEVIIIKQLAELFKNAGINID